MTPDEEHYRKEFFCEAPDIKKQVEIFFRNDPNLGIPVPNCHYSLYEKCTNVDCILNYDNVPNASRIYVKDFTF